MLFPKEELYGLVSQMRRAAVSIPSNIAEGAARNSNKEFAQFLYISMGSLAEIETQLTLAKRLNYPMNKYTLDEVDTIRKMTTGLINYLKRGRE
jgi:four helix bundle protein